MYVLLVEGLGGRRLPLLEVAMQSAFQEKCSYTLANEIGRGGVSVAVAAVLANSSAASLPGMPL